MIVHLIIRILADLIIHGVLGLEPYVGFNFLRRLRFHPCNSLNTGRLVYGEDQDDILDAVECLRELHGRSSCGGPDAMLYAEFQIFHRIRLDDEEARSFFEDRFLLVHHLERLVLSFVVTTFKMWTWL